MRTLTKLILMIAVLPLATTSKLNASPEEDAKAVAAAGGELQRVGFELLHPARTEPWGQTVTRLLTDDGLIIGISYAPSLHDELPA